VPRYLYEYDKENDSCFINNSNKYTMKQQDSNSFVKYFESTYRNDPSAESCTPDKIAQAYSDIWPPKSPFYTQMSSSESHKTNSNQSKIAAEFSYHNPKPSTEKVKFSLEENVSNMSESCHKKQQSEVTEYRCQKCSNLFDEKSHLPLCLPSGHFFCKECIIKMQIQKNSSKGESPFQIPKDIGRLPVLSMLINLPPHVAHQQVVAEERDQKEASGTQKAVKLCHKHSNEKLLYLCEESQEVVCVYCAFSLKQANPTAKIEEIDKTLDKMLEVFKDKFEDKFAESTKFYNSVSEKTTERQKDCVKLITECYERVSKQLSIQKSHLLDQITES